MIEPWFSNTYSFIPGVAVGMMGAVIGVLTGVLAPRGKYLQLLFTLYLLAIVASLVMLIAGAVALAAGQPYGVWYGLGLAGLIGVIVFGLTFGVARRRYQDSELRKMRAADLG
jgi:MFS family permease